MIDIHCHILPNVDDGAHSLEESLEMCRLSAEDGINIMVATPHAHDSVHKTHDPGFLRIKVDELNRQLNGKPQIKIGCELRFTHDIVRNVCQSRTAPTLADGPYVLVEFPHAMVPPGSHRVLFELMNNQITPIIAHPERNQMLMSEPEAFYHMIEMGALGQADAGSFTGQFGRRVREAAQLMLESGLLHFVASDCHNTRNRLPGLSASVAEVTKLVGPDYAHAMVEDNPSAVVESRPIPVIPPAELPRKRKRWLFF